MSQPTEPTEADPPCDDPDCGAAKLDGHSHPGEMVGGRPAAPTREQVAEAIGRGTRSTDRITERFISQATNRVVALLSRPAAEPPGPERNELLRLLDHFDRYVSSPDQTGYVGTPFYDEIQAALAGHRSADGVAAEPKEHGDG